VEKKGQRPVRQSKQGNILGTQAGNVASIAKQVKPDAYEIITETEFKKQYEYPDKA
jgi:hypothetical protein